MGRKEIWAFFVCGLRVVLGYHSVFYEYHFINTPMTWSAAQQFCRENYDDLATFTSMDDIRRVTRPSGYSYAWIGLFDDLASWSVMSAESNSWRLLSTGSTRPGGFQAPWEAGEPSFHGAAETCLMMRSGHWLDANCQVKVYALCVNGSKDLILVESYYTWSEARDYCREHHVNLGVIEDASELTRVTNLITHHWVWLGLYRQPFRWSDNRISPFTNWINGEPDNKVRIEHCVVESSYPGHPWLDATCETTYVAICQRAIKTKTTLFKVALQTAADLTSSEANTQIPNKLTKTFQTYGITDVKLSWKKIPVKVLQDETSDENCV